MIEEGYLKNMGAIIRGPEKIWNKKQFLLHSPLQLKLWLVPKFQSIFNPCNPLQQTTGNKVNAKIYSKKPGPLFLEFSWRKKKKKVLAF